MIRPTKAIAVTLVALTIIGCSASLKSAAESAETLITSTTPATVQATTATTFTEPVDPEPLTAEEQAAWNEVTERLNVAWGTADLRYSRAASRVLIQPSIYAVIHCFPTRSVSQIRSKQSYWAGMV